MKLWWICLFGCSFLSHLFVHEDVDDGVVNRGRLGEVGGQGCQGWLDGDVLVGGHHSAKVA